MADSLNEFDLDNSNWMARDVKKLGCDLKQKNEVDYEVLRPSRQLPQRNSKQNRFLFSTISLVIIQFSVIIVEEREERCESIGFKIRVPTVCLTIS